MILDLTTMPLSELLDNFRYTDPRVSPQYRAEIERRCAPAPAWNDAFDTLLTTIAGKVSTEAYVAVEATVHELRPGPADPLAPAPAPEAERPARTKTIKSLWLERCERDGRGYVSKTEVLIDVLDELFPVEGK